MVDLEGDRGVVRPGNHVQNGTNKKKFNVFPLKNQIKKKMKEKN